VLSLTSVVVLGASVAVVGLLPGTTSGTEPAGTALKAAITVTEKDFGRSFSVKNGDVIEVSLPASVPLSWVPKNGPQATLEPVEPVEKPPAVGAPPRPQGQPPMVGGVGRWTHFYKVHSDQPVRVEPSWVYARFGRLAATNKRIAEGVIPTPPEFRPGQKPSALREGMDFHFNLDVRP